MPLVLQDADVEQLLSMEECIEAMEAAFRDFGNGRAVNIPRIRYQCATSDEDVIYGSNIHIGAVPFYDVAAVRIGSMPRTKDGRVRKPKEGEGPARNWGHVSLLDMRTGETLALLHEFYLSGIRVGATTGLAAKYLAPPQASTLGLFGSGKLARTDLEALAAVRPLRRVKVFSPNEEHRYGFAKEMGERLGIAVEAVDEPREVVEGVEMVCCCTNAGYVSGTTVLKGEWLEPGQFVVSIQNSDVNFFKTEVDEETLRRSSLICINDRESVFSNNQQELLGPIERGVVSWDRVVELGHVAAGRVSPDVPPDGIVYYKNNSGMGIQMAAAGAVIYRNAVRKGVGEKIPSDWFGSDVSAWSARGFSPSS